MPMKNPPHPGRIIKDECIPALGLTIGAAAEALGVSRQSLDKVVNGRGAISPDMAIRLEQVFGSTADVWLGMQAAYDLAQARLREPQIAATIRKRFVEAA